MQKAFSIILIVSFMLFSFRVNLAQANHAPLAKKRPTVGLVLSGGGARGLAHIGVLKALEEKKIPVDYIGGASMGALIGAMYAMGKSPAEIEEFVNNLEWDKYLQTTIFDNLSFRRKEDRRNIPSPIILKGKANDLKLPNGLNAGHEIGLLFDQTTLPYAEIKSFSELPIPFQCVGTDMVNGESVVLKDGSLSRALRATMSIPGVFTPVEIDGRILSDGGLVNNIPTNLLKDMGADIILVVNIETQLGDRESLDNLLGVLSQTINIASADNSRRSLRQADFIIAPDLQKFTTGDFKESRKIIELGYIGATQKTPLLQSLSLNDADWQEHLENRRNRRLPDTPFVPTFVAVDAKNEESVKTIKEKLNSKYNDKPLDSEKQTELAKELSQLVGTGRFETLDYGITEEKGKKGLLIDTNESAEKPSKPTRLELGFDVNSVETDNVNFNFLARMTIFDVGRYGTEWRNDLILGSNTLLASEYYRPLGKGRFFIAPRASYSRNRINFFSGGSRASEYVVQRFQTGFDVGYNFNLRSELRAGYTIGYERASRRIGDTVLPNIKGAFSVAGVKWTYDGLDKSQVPTKGVLSQNSLNYFFDSPDAAGRYVQAETKNLIFHQFDERRTLFVIGNAGTSFRETAPQLQKFTLGGPFRLGGYGYDEFRSSNYLQGGVGFLYNPISFSSFLGGKVYTGAWYEGGSAFETLDLANYRQSVTGGAIVETPLGPVFLGASINEKGRSRIYFSFGRIFRFNK